MRISTTRSRVIGCALASLLTTVAVTFLQGALPRAAADSGALLTWNPLAARPAPAGRLNAAMAFDAATGTTVLFGGRTGIQLLADTWTWDGTTWTAQNPASRPPPLESASMAYDSVGRRILLFGGLGLDGNATSATWAWNGTTWSALTPTSVPPARYGASMATDAVTGTDVLFGGLSAPGSSLGDTWSWDGTNWTPRTPAASPQARSGAAMTFDAARGLDLLFGGTTGSDNRADTWTWDGTNWTQMAPAASPPARNDAALAFDTATQTAVLFGGSADSAGTTALGDTWLWNGSTWSTSLPLSLLPSLNPPPRVGASIAGGFANQRLVLFGGQSGGPSPITFDDTWSVSTVTTTTASTLPATTVGPPGEPTTAPVARSTTTSTTLAVAGKPGAGPPPTTTAPTPTATPTTVVAAPLDVTSRSAHPGDEVTISGSGFTPRAPITISFDATTVAKGTTFADDKGRFTATVVVPADASSGSHHIKADGAARSGGQAVLVAQMSITGHRGHHSWLLPALMVALTVLVAGGAGVVLTASTRRHLHHPTRSS